MKTQYKYIHFKVIEEKPRTKVWGVFNNKEPDEPMATIEWYGAWRQYCFFPAPDMVFSQGCLEGVNDFIRQLMEARKK